MSNHLECPTSLASNFCRSPGWLVASNKMELRFRETFEEVRRIKEERAKSLSHRVFRLLHRAVVYDTNTRTLWVWKAVPLDQDTHGRIRKQWAACGAEEAGRLSALLEGVPSTPLSQLVPTLALCPTESANLELWFAHLTSLLCSSLVPSVLGSGPPLCQEHGPHLLTVAPSSRPFESPPESQLHCVYALLELLKQHLFAESPVVWSSFLRNHLWPQLARLLISDLFTPLLLAEQT